MASAFTVSPSALHDHDHIPDRPASTSSTHLGPSAVSADPELSPLLSQVGSDTLSPPSNYFEAATSNRSHTDEFGDHDHSDPFFGADFNALDSHGPSFLNDSVPYEPALFPSVVHHDATATAQATRDPYPLTPEQTASIHTTSPRSELRDSTHQQEKHFPTSISPQELQKPFQQDAAVTQTSQLTPSLSSSCRTSEDGLAPAPTNMQPRSPRVLVSVWDRDDQAPTHAIERSFEESPGTVRAGIESAGDLISSSGHHSATGRWQDESRGRAGLNPTQRPTDEIASINEVMAQRDSEERKGEVSRWLTDDLSEAPTRLQEQTPEEIREFEKPRDSQDNIPLGDQTENRYVDGQTYYAPTGATMSPEDYEIISSNRNWADAPVLHHIQHGIPGRHQPQTSQAAIERWQNMAQDNMSIMSRAATWGTRRRSLPSILDSDIEGVTSGSFLKKLSLNKGSGDSKGSKAGGFFQELRGLVRRPSTSTVLKRTRSRSRSRSRSDARDAQPESPTAEDPTRRGTGDSSPLLSLPTRSDSGSKKPTPSINTALVSIAHNVASIGATHTRKGSVSGGSIVTSPKAASSSLTVKNTLRRRSKSEVPKPTMAPPALDTHQNLVGMWKRSGGPPVASISNKNHADLEDDDDDEDDMLDDADLTAEANLIDGTKPNLAGFQEHVLKLNPSLAGTQSFLVNRIAWQQITRYKQLLTAAVLHLKQGQACPCGPNYCLSLGGSAKILDTKGDNRGLDTLADHLPDEEEGGPSEGAINPDSFPQDIPMPPTQYLPAEFECQLCFQRKKFQKPSDWTKHVHEDVQPFTCTWDKCTDGKIFKRKADWVRHENEGHRHLEWWACDVDECRHKCYRRDNFLQHLVREHKFQEPKIKTKAAMKRAGGGDPTWLKVEQCHVETPKRPHEEPCRFCGKTFPTWKKLTVHLAKHMEQISLPVLRLVAAKAREINADTIISPIEDPPPRPMIPSVTHTPTGTPFVGSLPGQMPFGSQHLSYQNQNNNMLYPVMAGQYEQPYLNPQGQFTNHHHQNINHSPMAGSLSQGFGQTDQMPELPVTTGPYMQDQNAFMHLPVNATNGNHAQTNMDAFGLNALGLQNLNGTPLGMHMGYTGIMDPSSGHASPFSGQGSVSPYQRSPHQNHGTAAETAWDDRQQTGFL